MLWLIILIIVITIIFLTVYGVNCNKECFESLMLPTITNKKLSSRIIPSIIIQSASFPLVHKSLQKCADSFQSLNPNYKYLFFSNKGCYEFFKVNYPPVYLEVYESIIPSALRSDFFRLCALYKLGGFWADIRLRCHIPLDEVIEEGTEFVSAIDTGINFKDYLSIDKFAVWNGFMGCAPRLPFIKNCIDIIKDRVLNIHSHLSTFNALAHTGPLFVGKTLMEFYPQIKLQVLNRKHPETPSVHLYRFNSEKYKSSLFNNGGIFNNNGECLLENKGFNSDVKTCEDNIYGNNIRYSKYHKLPTSQIVLDLKLINKLKLLYDTEYVNPKGLGSLCDNWVESYYLKNVRYNIPDSIVEPLDSSDTFNVQCAKTRYFYDMKGAKEGMVFHITWTVHHKKKNTWLHHLLDNIFPLLDFNIIVMINDYNPKIDIATIEKLYKLKHVRWVLCQHANIDNHPKLIRIPSGIDYHSYYENNSYNTIQPQSQEKALKLLNDRKLSERKMNVMTYSKCWGINISELVEIKKGDEFWRRVCEYIFVAIPGLDSNKVWEVLALGSIPIVLSSKLDSLYDNLPVVIVDTWGEVDLTFIQNKYNSIEEDLQNGALSYTKLSLSYWKNLIRKLQRGIAG